MSENQHSVTMYEYEMDVQNSRFPFCIVWTPIPMLTWFLPVIGHMGIALSNGVIRDFAGPYHVAEDNFAFGKPTMYWQMDPLQAHGGVAGWDMAITEASEIYKKRMHNICCDNCHSHVATALNLMQYQGSTRWNMVRLALLIICHGKYINLKGVLKTWLPFLIIIFILVIALCFVQIR